MVLVEVTGAGGFLANSRYRLEFGGPVQALPDAEEASSQDGIVEGKVAGGIDSFEGPYPVKVKNISGGTWLRDTPDITVSVGPEGGVIPPGQQLEFMDPSPSPEISDERCGLAWVPYREEEEEGGNGNGDETTPTTEKKKREKMILAGAAVVGLGFLVKGRNKGN